jgi:hypothetical protein
MQGNDNCAMAFTAKNGFCLFRKFGKLVFIWYITMFLNEMHCLTKKTSGTRAHGH